MSYRCGICRSVVPAGLKLRRHALARSVVYTITRMIDGKLQQVREERRETSGEIPVCASCEKDLKTGGYTVDSLTKAHRPLPSEEEGPPDLYLS